LSTVAEIELQNSLWLVHPSEDALEEYTFRRLPEAEVEALEEHLLTCGTCQESLAEIDQFTAAIKAVALELRTDVIGQSVGREYSGSASAGQGWMNWLRVQTGMVSGWAGMVSGWRAVWAAGLATGCVAVLLTTQIAIRSRTVGLPAPVTLEALRGGGDGVMARGPASRPLTLTIEAADISACGGCRVEVVNAAGKPIWNGTPTVSSGRLTATVPMSLHAGIYWVRLYTPEAGLIREFGLRLD